MATKSISKMRYLFAVILFTAGGCAQQCAPQNRSDTDSKFISLEYKDSQGREISFSSKDVPIEGRSYYKVFYAFDAGDHESYIGVVDAWSVDGQGMQSLEEYNFTEITAGRFVRKYDGQYGAVIEDYQGRYYVTIYVRDPNDDGLVSVELSGQTITLPCSESEVVEIFGEPNYISRTETFP